MTDLSDREFEGLVDAYLDATLSPESFARLNQALHENPHRVRRLAQAVQLDMMVQAEVICEGQAGLFVGMNASPDTAADRDWNLLAQLADLDDASGDSGSLVDLTERLKQESRIKKARSTPPAHSPVAPEHVRRVIVIPTWAVAAGIAAVFVFMATLIWQGAAETPAPDPVAETTIDQTDVSPVAEVLAAYDAHWHRDATPASAGLGLTAQRYELTRGWVKFRTTHGVEVVAEAPAVFELSRDNRLALSLGRMVSTVPPDAVGFTIDTPTGEVIDHGTEFGVDVDTRGLTQSHVFVGEIEVHSQGNSLRLVKGQAASIDHFGTITRSERPLASLFARQIPATAYHAAVLRSRPMCYWRGAIDPQTRQVTDSGWLEAHGLARAGVRNDREGFAPGDETGSLVFDGSDNGAISMPYRPALSFEGAYTIEAWCWIDPSLNHINMRLASTRSMNGGIGLAVRLTQDAGTPDGIGAVKPFYTFFEIEDVHSDDRLPTRQWAHLVVAVDEQRKCQIWINGDPSTTLVIPMAGGRRQTGPGEPLMIGRNPYDGDVTQPWRGRLDELAVYDRVLTQQEIRDHYHSFERP